MSSQSFHQHNHNSPSNPLLKICGLFSALLLWTQVAIAEGPKSPVDAKQSLNWFQIHPECRIELVACEPQIVDPVAIEFDERGRLWVVEMRDYPHGPGEGTQPSSKIKILEDKNGDGFYETASVFADELLFVTGLQLWQDGAIVTLAGKIVFLRDKDHDLRADHQEVWFEGFTEENSQLRANHPTLSLDGRVFVANGLRGGSIKNVRLGGEAISINGLDFAFDPHSGKCETVSGVGQFGLTFDQHANRFVCTNRNPLTQIVIENHYLQRATKTRVPAITHDAAKAGEESRIYPISQFWTTSNLHAGQFTAACGVTIYQGTAMPKGFQGNAFTCDPTGNLVHREVFQSSAPSPALNSQPGRTGVEFLASTDTWFRPVNLENGPEGALYVVDMYRAVIEHPQFMPEELQKRPDLLLGKNAGRIYRIRSKNGESIETPVFKLFEKNTDLVDLLGDENVWQRETAARLILQSRGDFIRDQNAIDALKKVAEAGLDPLARVQALWLLKNFELISPKHIVAAMQDTNADVRRQAIILSEPFLATDENVRAAFLKLASDEDVNVRFQFALSSLYLPQSVDIEILTALLRKSPNDQWVRQAVIMSGEGRLDQLLQSLLNDRAFVKSARESDLIQQLLANVAASAEPETIYGLFAQLHAITKDDGHELLSSATLGAASILQRRGINGASLLETFPAGESKELLRKWVADLLKLAQDTNQALKSRADAVQLVTFFGMGQTEFREMALHEPDPVVRTVAINTLSADDKAIWQKLLSRFQEESPEIRKSILTAGASNSLTAMLVVQAIEDDLIRPYEVDRLSRDRLLNSNDAAVKERATKLLGAIIKPDRAEVLASYRKSATQPGDAVKGKALFTKNCAACHKFGEIGNNVGPDISDTRVKTKEQLLFDIINPNGAIDANFISYLVETVDGKSYAGVIAAENASTVTLKMPENKTVNLLRSEIESIGSTGFSLMPEGLERDISVEEMTDLLSYLKNWRYLDGAVPVEAN